MNSPKPFETPRWSSIPFDNLRYPSIPFEAPRDAFEALRTLSKPFGPLPLLHHIFSLDPSGPPLSTNNFELLKRQFEPFRISRLISQAPLAGLRFPLSLPHADQFILLHHTLSGT